METELASRSLTEFVRQAWPVIRPSTPYVHNWHIDAIADHLEAVTRGEITRLLINMPPRFMKSILVGVMWPAWEWINSPSIQWLTGSYADRLAIRDAREMRTLIESPWYRERWGDRFVLTSDQNEKRRFENDKHGHRIAFSIGGGVTGEGGDRIILDDPHDYEKAQSDTERETATTNFDQQVSTRLNQPAYSAIVIVMQRLHEKDLSGHVLEAGGYQHLLLPMHYDPKRSKVTVLGKYDPRTQDGELAWPERFPQEVVDNWTKTLGSYGASGQLEQSPTPVAGGIFKRAWWKWYTVAPAQFDEIIQSWDFAVKDSNDYVVGQVWGRVGARYYLLDQVRALLDFPASVQAVRTLTAKWPHSGAKLVEDKANGPAVIATLKDEIAGLIAVSPDGDKRARALAVTPAIEAGNVFLPDPTIAPWINDYIEELSIFDNGAHDDQVDATSQGLHRMMHGIGQGWSQFEALRTLSGGGTKAQVQTSVRKVPPPEISHVAPGRCSANGDEVISIVGRFFADAVRVTIDDVAVWTEVVDQNRLNITTQPHARGRADVIVTTPHGSAKAKQALEFA